MFRLFYRFVQEAGQAHSRRLIVLFLMLIIAGLVEITGIALVFPLIALVDNPDIVLTTPYLKVIYDYLGFQDPKYMVYATAGAIGFIFVLKNLFMIFCQSLQLRMVKKWRDDLSQNIMRSYLVAPYSFHLKRTSTDLINNLTHTIYFVLNSFVFSMIMMMTNIAIIVMLLIFILCNFLIPSLIAGSFLGTAIFLQSRWINNYTSGISEKINAAMSDNLSILSQAFIGIKETKSFLAETYFQEKFKRATSLVNEQDRRMIFMVYLPIYLNEISLVITVIIMSCLVMASNNSAVDNFADLAIMAAVMFRMAPLLSRALSSYSSLRSSEQSVVEVLKELDILKKYNNHNLSRRHLDKQSNSISFDKEISLNNISYGYISEKNTIKGLSFTIEKGKFVGIVGTSGAGKTTIIDIIMGLLTPSEGAYKIDNQIIADAQIGSLRSMMGYVSQSPYFSNGTIRENIAFGVAADHIDDERITELVSMVQLQDLFANNSMSVHDIITDNAKTLSGGQRQRLAIARALYHDPQILILDEATSSLDNQTETEIMKVIDSIKGRVTVIAIAHRLSTLETCDKIITMDHGKITHVDNR